MRRTLFLEKYDTTYIAVLKAAQEQGVVILYPIECYVQRQQLKFMWKLLHLGDMSLQRIVLHGKLDPRYSQGRGGRQRTYKHCIKEAMENFNVTMEQCINMAQQEWDTVIEGAGIEAARQRWEVRPKASKPIDVDWRNSAVLGSGQKKRTSTKAAAGAHEIDGDREEDSERSSTLETESEDEFAQSHDGNHAENVEWAEMENLASRNRDWEGEKAAPPLQRQGSRRHNCRESDTDRQVDRDGVVPPMRPPAESAVADSRAETKRKGTNNARNRKRDCKRAKIETTTGFYQNRSGLQLIVEEGMPTQYNNIHAIPWDHRGMLGQTRGDN